MQYWLVKNEPEAYAWETFVKDGKTSWDGVRNYQARNNLRGMKLGDHVLFYASVTGKTVRGIAEVSKAAYPDKTAEEGDWSSVELKVVKALPKEVALEEIKSKPSLANLPLLKHSRLSVMPVTKAEYTEILKLGGG